MRKCGSTAAVCLLAAAAAGQGVAQLLHRLGSAVGVTPLVVVPAANLDHVATDHVGEAGVEDAGVRVGNDVLEHESVLGVLENALERALGSLLHGSVHLLHRHVALEDGDEVGQGARRGRHAEGSTVEQALELGNHLTDSLGSTGGGGDDVDGGGAHAASVLVRQIQNALVVRVGVNRAHHALLDAPLVVEHLHHRGKAVRRAGSVGHDVVLGRIVLVVVDADAERQVRILGGSGDEHLLGTGLQVTLSLLASREQTRGLQNHVHAQLLPGQLVRAQHAAEDLDLVAVHHQNVLALHLNRALELALRGVELQQVSGGLNRGKVVNGNNLLKLGLGHRAQHVAANASETVNSVFSHSE